MRGELIATMTMIVAALVGCGSQESSSPPDATTASRSPAMSTTVDSGPSSAEIAAAAERLVRENAELMGQLEPGMPFLAFKCSDELVASHPEDCWQPWLNGFSYDSGNLRVRLQVDRSDPFSTLQAERAAIWFRNFIDADKLGCSATTTCTNVPGILNTNVDRIIITDGTGVEMAQQQALRR